MSVNADIGLTGEFNTYSDILVTGNRLEMHVFCHTDTNITTSTIITVSPSQIYYSFNLKLEVRMDINVGWSSSCCFTCFRFRGETLAETPWAENVGPTAAPHQPSDVSSKQTEHRWRHHYSQRLFFHCISPSHSHRFCETRDMR